MKNKIISIFSFACFVIYLVASFLYPVLPKIISLIPFIVSTIPLIISFFEGKKEKENKEFFELIVENKTLREDLSEKEREVFLERTKNKEWDLVINSLKNKSLLKENLIRKYSKPLPIILFQYGNQKINNKKEKFVTEKLEKEYNVRSLGGSLKVIPPNKVPKNVKNGQDLRKWFENKIQSKYEGSTCIISVLAIVDLKNVYWKTDYDYNVRYYTSLGKALSIEDIFQKDEIPKLLASENISVLDPVLSGDIAFLCSNFLSDKELNLVYKNQEEIERKMGNLSLMELSKEENIKKISISFSKYFKNNQEISERIIKEANFWIGKLSRNGKN